jgi:hypothetical protein
MKYEILIDRNLRKYLPFHIEYLKYVLCFIFATTNATKVN